MVGLGSLGEVREAAVVDGGAVLSEILLKTVKSWRFLVSEGAPPQTFTIHAEWNPGPPSSLI